MSDRRPWFKLDVGYLDNPKINELLDDHPRAVILHLFCIAYSKQHGTNGRVPMRLAMRRACSTQCDLEICMQLGILRMDGETHIVVHDYIEHQGTAEKDQSRSDKARQAAQARWADANRNASGNASSIPVRNASGNAEKRREEKNKDSRSTGVEHDFDEWYSTYPRKQGRGQALRAYKTATKKADHATLVAAVQQQTSDLMRKGREFCPLPATWLNGERWADDTSSEPVGDVWDRSGMWS